MHEDCRADGTLIYKANIESTKFLGGACVATRYHPMVMSSPSHYHLPSVNHHRGTKTVHRSSTRDSPAITELRLIHLAHPPELQAALEAKEGTGVAYCNHEYADLLPLAPTR